MNNFSLLHSDTEIYAESFYCITHAWYFDARSNATDCLVQQEGLGITVGWHTTHKRFSQ
jgi:hypothetical protein